MPEQIPQAPVDAVDPKAPAATETSAEPDANHPTPAQIETYFKSRAESSKRVRKSKASTWKRNVELRMGQPVNLYTEGMDLQDDGQSEINPDWSLTKTKTANLYSQVPTIRLTHENKQYAQALPPFAKSLNYEIGPKRSRVGVAMEEMLNDVVNAAGVGAIVVGYAARFQSKTIPAIDTKLIPKDILGQLQETPLPEGTTADQVTPEMLGPMLQARQLPMITVKQVVSDKFFTKRVSPLDLLWPSDFTGSDFDDGDFIGYSGRCSWPEAKIEFKLQDLDYEKCVQGIDKDDASLRTNPERAGLAETKSVKYDELFYWRYRVDPEETSFSCIWRIVYVEGLDKPPIHEPWKGQKLDPKTGKYLGNHRFPVQVCTLTYISDNPIPPSDSEAARPQVNDLRRSRRDMFNNRERSLPIRWFDVNRIDQVIQEQLMRGTWQGMIPTNGDGSRSIGEIARASYPAENLAFDQSTKADLLESWQIGPNQAGTTGSGDETAAEAQITQQNFATRIGQERGRVAQTFLRVAELVAGFMVLYSDFPVLSEQERQMMFQTWDQKSVLQDLVFKILPDSQIVLDSNARIKTLVGFLNMTVKSGFVNPKDVIWEIAELSGIDPTGVVVDPNPPVEEPNVSYRFSGKDDLTNSVVMAMLIAKKQAPTVEQIKEAKILLLAAAAPAETPGAPEQSVPPAGQEGGSEAPPPADGPPPGPRPMNPTDGAHPDWHLASKVGQRSRDTEA